MAYVVAMMGFSQDKRLLCRANAFRHSSGSACNKRASLVRPCELVVRFPGDQSFFAEKSKAAPFG